MARFVPLSPSTHRDLKWQRFEGYRFAAADALVPLVAAEISRAAMSMPVAFVEQNGATVLMAVMSLAPGRNLFVGPDGRWLGGYVPSALRGYPFRLLPVKDRNETVLCFDADSGLIGENAAGEGIFTGEGQLAKGVADTLDFLKQTELSRAVMERAVAALAEAGVLEPWPVSVKGPNGEQPVSGLKRVAEGKLNGLDEAAFLKLRAAGALPVAYAQLLSTQHLALLGRLADLHDKVGAAKAKGPASPAAGMIDANEDGTLKFNF